MSCWAGIFCPIPLSGKTGPSGSLPALSAAGFPGGFRFKNAEIEVITLSDDHLFLCEFVREDDDELLLILFNNSYLVRKISDDVDETVFASSGAAAGFDIGSPAEPGSKYTGVLLGLRAPNPDQNGRQNDHYRTLWLALEDQKLAPVLETEGLFFREEGVFTGWRLPQKRWRKRGRLFNCC